MSLLSVEGLAVAYGDSRVLWDVGFDMAEGEIVALVGANGAGKTTLLRALTGLIPVRSGQMRFAGADLNPLKPYERARRGIAMVPEGRRLFAGLTVRQNLKLGATARPSREGEEDDLAFVFQLFPELVRLEGRLAGLMSGGEQQMCAIGRALMARPSLLLIDEMSLGLAPVIVDRIADAVRQVNRERGITVLLVEQDVGLALEIATRGYVLDTGRITIDGPADDLLRREDIRAAYLGLN
ncbi:ABC transporter ATP-binding protein [Xanthobacter flavus]|uniref:ABC transporter ATP-binding protein n=1 Tax=Xanthobacter flavus TaxID=281 RepID=UPI001AE9E4F0|nr:ABC transporter ATP-binding protein [Xanthobacter flavus]MBP2151173.1 branched-chain amino acid transport system ATP-binding protein [Xanthobacter flavus]